VVCFGPKVGLGVGGFRERALGDYTLIKNPWVPGVVPWVPGSPREPPFKVLTLWVGGSRNPGIWFFFGLPRGWGNSKGLGHFVWNGFWGPGCF